MSKKLVLKNNKDLDVRKVTSPNGLWYKIRSWPTRKGVPMPGYEPEVVGSLVVDKFIYCLVDWDPNIVDPEGNSVPCNDANKEFFYEEGGEEVMFVLREMNQAKNRSEIQEVDEAKN